MQLARLTVLIVLIALGTSASIALAQIYRSVDAHGNVTFSSVPPQGVKSTIVDIDPLLPLLPRTTAPALDALGIANKAPGPDPQRDELALALREERRERQLRAWRARCHAERLARCNDAAELEARYQRSLDWMLPGATIAR